MLVITTQLSPFALRGRADADRSSRSCKGELFNTQQRTLSEWKQRWNSGFSNKQQVLLLRDVKTSTPSLSVSSAKDPVETSAASVTSTDPGCGSREIRQADPRDWLATNWITSSRCEQFIVLCCPCNLG